MIWDDEDPDKVTIRDRAGSWTRSSTASRAVVSSRLAGEWATSSRQMHRLLPTIIYEELKKRGIADDDDAFKKWLNKQKRLPGASAQAQCEILLCLVRFLPLWLR